MSPWARQRSVVQLEFLRGACGSSTVLLFHFFLVIFSGFDFHLFSFRSEKYSIQRVSPMYGSLLSSFKASDFKYLYNSVVCSFFSDLHAAFCLCYYWAICKDIYICVNGQVCVFIYVCIHIYFSALHTRGDPPKQDLFIKNCVFILTCLNFSHISSIPHSMQYTYWDIFSTPKTVLNLWISMPSSASTVFFHFFYISKTFPFEDFFIQGNKKKLLQASSGE